MDFVLAKNELSLRIKERAAVEETFPLFMNVCPREYIHAEKPCQPFHDQSSAFSVGWETAENSWRSIRFDCKWALPALFDVPLLLPAASTIGQGLSTRGLNAANRKCCIPGR